MNSPLRVLIIRNAYQKDAGGAEQYALNLSVALKRAGHQPLLVTKVLKIHEKSKLDNIRCISGPWHDSQQWDRWYYIRFPAYSLWYAYIILRHRIKIVHPQSRDDFIFATAAARLLRKKVVWTDHADLKYVLDQVNHYNPRMRKWLISACQNVSVITCSSKNEKKEIEAVAPELKNLKVVYNGVFLPRDISPRPKTNKFVIGTNARLVENKGISELISGFAKLGMINADLWLLGGVSGNKKKYETLAKRLGVNTRVKFLDYVSNPNDYVSAMDIFVHASYHEAFSLAIIEAAMLGKPIIATNVGGTPEIIDSSCGILIEPRNIDDITNSIKSLINHPDKRHRLGRAASNKAIKIFEFQNIVETKIIPLYLTI